MNIQSRYFLITPRKAKLSEDEFQMLQLGSVSHRLIISVCEHTELISYLKQCFKWYQRRKFGRVQRRTDR